MPRLDRPCGDDCNNPKCCTVRCFGILPTVHVCGADKLTQAEKGRLADWIREELAR